MYKSISREGVIKFVGVLLFVFIVCYAMQPVILIEGEGKFLFSMSAAPGKEFSTRFIHSVQKTPVEEYFVVNDDCNGFILKSTRYRSFGVGLPFLESDGNFRREGDDFIMDDLNRPIQTLDLRPGLGTELTLTINNQEILLYQLVSLGSFVRVSIIRNYELGMRNFIG